MDQKELETKIREALSDEAFVKRLFAMEEPEQVQAALAEKEIELSVPDIIKLKDMLVQAESKNGELTEEDLADVSGGSVVVALFCLAALGAGVLVSGAGFGVGYGATQIRGW